MAGSREYSRYQKGVIRRFYEHRDSTLLARLAEITSDLAIETDPKKIDRLWNRAGEALASAGANAARAESVVAARDLRALAGLVGELSR